jgi:N4-gp56 family major capsid protein
MAWTYDAPSGTYKNHSLSNKIRFQAIADTQFMPYTTKEPGFGKNKGESVTITRILRLPLATTVAETERLPSGRPPIQTKQVGVLEWGFKIPVTKFEENLTHFDITNQFQATLRDQMELTMDIMVAQAFKLTPIKYVPTAVGFTLTTNGTAGATSDRNLSVSDLREIHDYLSGTLKVPAYKNGKYVGILSTRAARGIKNDPEYKDWLAPTTSEPLMSGQLKDIEGFHLIETNNYGYETDALSNLAGTSLTTGEAVFFGADSVGILEVEAPELRMGVPEDLGRFREVGWVGTINAFHVWEQAATARVIHVTSL